MFSTTPSTGTSSVRNISAALRASAAATRGGCVTTTAPDSTTACARLSGMSPVPGGRSTTSTSSSGHATPRANCFTALETIGPRQIGGRALAEEEAEADDRQAVRVERQDVLLRRHADRLRAVLDAEQNRQARPVDVGVEQADAQPVARERERQIHRHGALAHAALARADRDDVAHRGEPHLLGPWIGYPGAFGRGAALGGANSTVTPVAPTAQRLGNAGLDPSRACWRRGY